MAEVVQIANSLSSGTKTCNSPSLSAADRMLKNIETDQSVQGRVRISWARKAVSAELELAEAALAANCLDYADKHFRSIIIHFRYALRNTTKSYEGYRQRALIGIDGVRQKRN